MVKIWFICGGLFGFLSVAFGAFGAHALSKTLSSEMLTIFETGVKYQFFHSIALLLIGVIQLQTQIDLTYSGWAFVVGTLIFSGSLYMLSITGLKWLGAVTPIGGIAFLIGWAWLVYQVIRQL